MEPNFPLGDISDSNQEHVVGVDGNPVAIDHTSSSDNSSPEVQDEAAVASPAASHDTAHEDMEENNEETKALRVRRFATIVNILNALLGAGILGVPNSMMNIGIVPSIILLFIIGLITHICTVLTIKLQMRTKADGLDDLAKRLLKKPGSIALSIMSMLFCYSCMVAYLIINFGCIASFFDFGGIVLDQMWHRVVVVFIFAVCIPIPLTFPRNIGFMKYLSYASFFEIIFYVLAMIIKGCIMLPYPKGMSPNIIIAKMDMGMFSSISIYGLAFALPVVVLPIVAPYNPDIRKRSIVSLVAVILCFLMVAIPGIIGYLLFGDKTKSIVIENFPSNDGLMIAVRIDFFFVVSEAYPAIAQSVMASWSEIFFKTNLQGTLPAKKRALVLFMTNIIPLGLAMFLPDAKPALNIGGAFGGCMVDFFFPSLMWIVISKKRWFHWQNLLCMLIMLIGFVCAVISTYQAILDAIAAFK